MQLNLIDTNQPLELSEAAFGQAYNESLVHQVVTAYQAAGRAGTHAQKTRAKVSGGGKKPWRQKGTGRARAGTIRSPLWRSGGVIFAAKPRDYSQKVNKKMYRGALRSIFSELLRTNALFVVEDLKVPERKTKSFVAILKNLGMNQNLLVVVDKLEKNMYLAARNLREVTLTNVRSLDPVSLMKYKQILMTAKAVKQIEGQLV